MFLKIPVLESLFHKKKYNKRYIKWDSNIGISRENGRF